MKRGLPKGIVGLESVPIVDDLGERQLVEDDSEGFLVIGGREVGRFRFELDALDSANGSFAFVAHPDGVAFLPDASDLALEAAIDLAIRMDGINVDEDGRAHVQIAHVLAGQMLELVAETVGLEARPAVVVDDRRAERDTWGGGKDGGLHVISFRGCSLD